MPVKNNTNWVLSTMGQTGGEERVIVKYGLYVYQNSIMGIAEVMDIAS